MNKRKAAQKKKISNFYNSHVESVKTDHSKEKSISEYLFPLKVEGRRQSRSM
jgi:hypothetical protein